jgi:hypothetical protein
MVVFLGVIPVILASLEFSKKEDSILKKKKIKRKRLEACLK